MGHITDIRFDPETPGLVYLATGGGGGGGDRRLPQHRPRRDLDAHHDPQLPGMADISTLAIATHPQHVLIGVDSNFYVYRSLDEGTTWQRANTADNRLGGSTAYVFADSDSTRLYAASFAGLYYSADAGTTWTSASGTFGSLQILSLAYGETADGRVVLYAATNGGQASASAGTLAGLRAAPIGAASPVRAGVYRYVVLTPRLTLRLSGLRGGTVLRSGTYLTAKGVVAPSALAGGQVKVQLQRWAHKWVAVKTVLRTIGSKGGYSWSYKPAKKGSYRLRITLAKTATHVAATTSWHSFKVR